MNMTGPSNSTVFMFFYEYLQFEACERFGVQQVECILTLEASRKILENEGA